MLLWTFCRSDRLGKFELNPSIGWGLQRLVFVEEYILALSTRTIALGRLLMVENLLKI